MNNTARATPTPEPQWDDFFRLPPPRRPSNADVEKVFDNNAPLDMGRPLLRLVIFFMALWLVNSFLTLYPWGIPDSLMRLGLVGEARARIIGAEPVGKYGQQHVVRLLMESGPRAGKTAECYMTGKARIFALIERAKSDFEDYAPVVPARYCTVFPSHAVIGNARTTPSGVSFSLAFLIVFLPAFALLYFVSRNPLLKRRIRTILKTGVSGEAELVRAKEREHAWHTRRRFLIVYAMDFFGKKRVFRSCTSEIMYKHLLKKLQNGEKARVIYQPDSQKRPLLADGIVFMENQKGADGKTDV